MASSMLSKLPFANKINTILSSSKTGVSKAPSDVDKGSVENFYDKLAQDYHMIFGDWHGVLKEQGEGIHSLIKENQILVNKEDFDASKTNILDCACGIGTQSIGLALQGYKLYSTDFSANSIERAKKEAYGTYKLNTKQIQFGIANFCYLEKINKSTFDNSDEKQSEDKKENKENGSSSSAAADTTADTVKKDVATADGTDATTTEANTVKDKAEEKEDDLLFDIIVALDNALPHLLDDDDILKSLSSMKRKLKKNGMIILSTRDYDEARDSIPPKRGDLPKSFLRSIDKDIQVQQIVFQTWDWSDCGKYYRLNHFIMIEKRDKNNTTKDKQDKYKSIVNITSDGKKTIEFNGANATLVKSWDVRHRQTIYNAIRRKTLLQLIEKAGLKSGVCLDPAKEKVPFYQPIFIAWNK